MKWMFRILGLTRDIGIRKHILSKDQSKTFANLICIHSAFKEIPAGGNAGKVLGMSIIAISTESIL